MPVPPINGIHHHFGNEVGVAGSFPVATTELFLVVPETMNHVKESQRMRSVTLTFIGNSDLFPSGSSGRYTGLC
jgi:hypothetical protein